MPWKVQWSKNSSTFGYFDLYYGFGSANCPGWLPSLLSLKVLCFCLCVKVARTEVSPEFGVVRLVDLNKMILLRQADEYFEYESLPRSVNNFSKFRSSKTRSNPLLTGLGDGIGLWCCDPFCGGILMLNSSCSQVCCSWFTFGLRCRARLPILGLRTVCGLRIWRIGDDGVIIGDAGGVDDSLSEWGLFNGLDRCRGIRRPGPELSDGVGGSPLLHAIEQ